MLAEEPGEIPGFCRFRGLTSFFKYAIVILSSFGGRKDGKGDCLSQFSGSNTRFLSLGGRWNRLGWGNDGFCFRCCDCLGKDLRVDEPSKAEVRFKKVSTKKNRKMGKIRNQIAVVAHFRKAGSFVDKKKNENKNACRNWRD